MFNLILVTGGAGYIGSHTNKALNNAGYETVVLDNLCKGYENFVKWGNFENYDFGSKNIREVFENYDIDGVIHFAAFSSVAESVELPQKYFKNNYKNTLNLLQVMREFGVDKTVIDIDVKHKRLHWDFLFTSYFKVWGSQLLFQIHYFFNCILLSRFYKGEQKFPG